MLGIVDVPVGDNSLFHALGVSVGVDGVQLRHEISQHLEREVWLQGEFQRECLSKSERLRCSGSAWGGRSVLAAFSHLKRLRVMLHTPSVEDPFVMEVSDVSHKSLHLQGGYHSLVHIMYDGHGHYKGLVSLSYVVGFPKCRHQTNGMTTILGSGSNMDGLENKGSDGVEPCNLGSLNERLEHLKVVPPLMLSCGLGALDLEIWNFVRRVMEPGSFRHVCKLAVWQRDLRARCADHDHACEFWHAVVYKLDLGLHAEIEAFSTLLQTDGWSYDMLGEWQRSLQGRTWKCWTRRRRWYKLSHQIDLSVSRKRVHLQLARLR